jgi:hypothetical protein
MATPYPTHITEELFVKLDDSPERLLVFKELFPEGKMPLTEENILKGWEGGLHIGVMAQSFFLLYSEDELPNPDFDMASKKAMKDLSDATDWAIKKNRPEVGEGRNDQQKVLLDEKLLAALNEYRRTIARAIVKIINTRPSSGDSDTPDTS